jgi:ATP-dependent Clp protease ATP-binding subunit ClpA
MLVQMLGSDEARKKLEQKLREQRREGPRVSTSVDLPLSNECKRALAYAAEEAGYLEGRHIGAEHLLLGLLREEKCEAARALNEHGLTLEKARAAILSEPPASTTQEHRTGRDLGLYKSHLELVDNASGEQLGLWPRSPFVPVPRIGEEVVLRHREHPARTFQV